MPWPPRTHCEQVHVESAIWRHDRPRFDIVAGDAAGLRPDAQDPPIWAAARVNSARRRPRRAGRYGEELWFPPTRTTAAGSCVARVPCSSACCRRPASCAPSSPAGQGLERWDHHEARGDNHRRPNSLPVGPPLKRLARRMWRPRITPALHDRVQLGVCGAGVDGVGGATPTAFSNSVARAGIAGQQLTLALSLLAVADIAEAECRGVGTDPGLIFAVVAGFAPSVGGRDGLTEPAGAGRADQDRPYNSSARADAPSSSHHACEPGSITARASTPDV